MSDQRNPLKLSRWLLGLLCPKERIREIEGDLNELFNEDFARVGIIRAQLNYLRSVISMANFGSSILSIKLREIMTLFVSILLKRVKSIYRLRSGTALGVLTLTCGLFIIGFLAFFIQHEMSYDGFHPQSDQIFRVNKLVTNSRGELQKQATAPIPAIPQLTKDTDEVLAGTRVQQLSPTIQAGTNVFEEKGFYLVDPEFFKLFPYEIVSGNNSNPLGNPQSVVITASAAQKYFGENDPIGQLLKVNLKKTYRVNFTEKLFTVTAVVEDPPSNTHLQFDFLASFSTLGDFKANDWFSGVGSYVLLNEGADLSLLEDKLAIFFRSNLDPYLQARFKMTYADFRATKRNQELELQHVTDIHVTQGYNQEFSAPVNRDFLIVLVWVCGLIGLLSIVNLFNISLAGLLGRSREFGMRKCMGASTGHIIFQIITEAMVVGMVAFVLSLVLTLALGPWLVQVTRTLPTDFYLSINYLLMLSSLSMIISILTGLSLALSMAKTDVSVSLRGSQLKGVKGKVLQKALLSVQFLIAFTAIISAFFFQAQNDFLLESPLGYNPDKLLVINNIEKIPETDRVQLLNSLSNSSHIQSLGLSYHIPNTGAEGLEYSFAEAQSASPLNFATMVVEQDFVDTYGIKIFQPSSDETTSIIDSTIVINQIAMRQLGYFDPSEMIGKKLKFQNRDLHITGIIEDFHFEDFYSQLEPLVLMNAKAFPEPLINPYRFLSVKLSGDEFSAHHEIERAWNGLSGTVPLDYQYLTDHLKTAYEQDAELGTIIKRATVFAILIALLGLLNMSHVIYKTRRKEMSVRKVLGASFKQLYTRFSRHFAVPLVLSFLISVPLVVVAMEQWLSKFAYRIDMDFGIFLQSAALMFSLILITITFNALRSASINPNKYLQEE